METYLTKMRWSKMFWTVWLACIYKARQVAEVAELTRSYLCPCLGQKSFILELSYLFFTWCSLWKYIKSIFYCLSQTILLFNKTYKTKALKIGQKFYQLRHGENIHKLIVLPSVVRFWSCWRFYLFKCYFVEQKL